MFRLLNEVCCNIFKRIAAMPRAPSDGANNVCLRLLDDPVLCFMSIKLEIYFLNNYFWTPTNIVFPGDL